MFEKCKIELRDIDIDIQALKAEDLISLLYERLDESSKALQSIQNIVTESYGCKDIIDFNSELLNPLWQVYNQDKIARLYPLNKE